MSFVFVENLLQGDVPVTLAACTRLERLYLGGGGAFGNDALRPPEGLHRARLRVPRVSGAAAEGTLMIPYE